MTNEERVRLYRRQVAYLKAAVASTAPGSPERRRVEEGLANAREGLRRATLESFRGGAA